MISFRTDESLATRTVASKLSGSASGAFSGELGAGASAYSAFSCLLGDGKRRGEEGVALASAGAVESEFIRKRLELKMVNNSAAAPA